MADKRVVVGGAHTGRGTCVLGGPTRIIVPLVSAGVRELREEVGALATHPHDLVEWRVDAALAAGTDLEAACSAVLDGADVPVLATVRTTHEGGRGDLSDQDYCELVAHLAPRVDAVDVEVLREGAQDLVEAAHRVGTRVIASTHDFSGTPSTEELVARLGSMESLGADVAKVACLARTPADVLAVLGAQVWALEGLRVPVIGISMGDLGGISRLAGSVLGCAATFATVGESSAPGQFDAERVRAVLDLLGS